MNSAVIIPCRMASTRLPGKVLLTVAGKEILRWVYDAAGQSSADEVVVTSCDPVIRDFCRDHGMQFIPSSAKHENGTERAAEIAQGFDNCDVIVNVQADEPLILPIHINQLLNGMREHRNPGMATLFSTSQLGADIVEKSVVKVALAPVKQLAEWTYLRAVYFSREMISNYKHHGIYAYERNTLLGLVKEEQTENEKRECLEQLRALDNGVEILCLEAPYNCPLHGVDVYDDLRLVDNLLQERMKE